MNENFSRSSVFCAYGRKFSALVVYTDNNAARDSTIACPANGDIDKKIFVAALAMETQLQLVPWYARVPTDSNTADAPSRHDVSTLIQAGAPKYDCDANLYWTHVLDRLGRRTGHNVTPLTKRNACTTRCIRRSHMKESYCADAKDIFP